MITADIAVSNHEHNGITIDGGLFMSNHASDIYGSYKNMSSDLQTIITAIQNDLTYSSLEGEVGNLASLVSMLQSDVNAIKDDIRGWEDDINDLNKEMNRLSSVIADIQSQIDNLVDFGTCTVVDTTSILEDENNVEA